MENEKVNDSPEASVQPEASPALEASEEVETVEETHIGTYVCDTCIHDNLLSNVGVGHCGRCKNAYCVHFSSKIDPAYCVGCLGDMTLTKEIITKTYEHYNEETDTTTRYSRRARRIELGGLDWLFVQRRIYTLSDAELDLSIEYHRQLCQQMLMESDRRKNEKMHRNAGVKIVIASPSTATQTVTTHTTSKKVTKTTSTKAVAKVSSLLDAMLASGMTLDQLKSVFKK